jgi:pilus assembly protein Flp/PilA
MLQAFLKDESGATAIEYGLIASLVSIAMIAAVMNLGDSIDRVYAQVNDNMAVAAAIPAAETPGDAVKFEPILDRGAIAIN